MKILEEKLDKERLMASILKSSSVSLKFVKNRFLDNNKEPPEKLIKTISKDAYASEDYLKIAIDKDMNVPQDILQGILNGSARLNLNIIKDPKLKKPFSEKDLENAISKDSYASYELSELYKKENKKIPSIIIQSMLRDSTTSLYLAMGYMNNGEKIPDAVFRSVSNKADDLFKLAIYMLDKNLDIPDIMLEALVANKNTYAMRDFDDVLYTYAKQNKEIPTILLDAASSLNWDKNLSTFCYKLASEKIKIPERILDIFIKKTPEYGPNWIGDPAYRILMLYLDKSGKTNYNNQHKENLLKSLPTKLYPYLMITHGNYMTSIVEGFLKNFGKVPEDFKQEILDHYDQHLGRKYIPKDIANAIGININEAVIINEKLSKEKLFDRFKRNHFERDKVIKTLVKNDKEIPQYLMEVIEKSIADSSMYAFLLIKKEKEVPENILNNISKSAEYSLSHAKEYMIKNQKIPDVLLKGISKDSAKSYDFGVTLLGVKKEIAPEIILNSIAQFPHTSRFYTQSLLHHKVKVPEIIKRGLSKSDFESLEKIEKKTITEALDKDRLMYMAVKETPVAIDLLTQLAYTDKDIPDLLSRVVAERSSANICARIASYIIAYSEKEVPEALLEKIATNRKIANDIAFIYKNNRKEIPDIIKNVLSKKNREFYEDDIWNFGATTNTINEALDKEKLLDVISKDEEAYNQILRHYFHDRNELPPENLIDMASKDVAAAIIFAEYCLEYKKEIRPDIIEKIAEYPRGAYTIASLMKIEDRDVPEILTNSIKKDPLSLKHYEEFLAKQHVPLNTKVYI
jgi:hypothetical protein